MRSNDTDSKNPEGSNGKEISSLQVLVDAAMCVLHNESFSSQASIVSTAESSTPESSKQTSISPIFSGLILPPKTLSSKRKSVRATNSLPDHVTSPDLIRSMALNQLKVAKQKAERELEAKTKYLSKLPVNKSYSQKSSTVKRNNKRRQKKTNLSSPVENLCIVCHGSFEEEEASGVINTTWIQCDKCSKWIHKYCIPLDFDYNADVFF